MTEAGPKALLQRRQLRADLARLADGDRSALEPAFVALQPFVRSFCRRLLDGPDAEDAAQEALVRLFEKVSDYDPSRDPLPWVTAFAVNACRTSRRRAGRRREVGEGPDLPHESTPEGAVLAAELRQAVQETLEGLSDLDAQTLRLAMGERPSEATFRKRLQRAMARFRLAWSDR